MNLNRQIKLNKTQEKRKVRGKLGESFETHTGFKQRDCLSAILFKQRDCLSAVLLLIHFII